jgi:hypothetical protein
MLKGERGYITRRGNLLQGGIGYKGIYSTRGNILQGAIYQRRDYTEGGRLLQWSKYTKTQSSQVPVLGDEGIHGHRTSKAPHPVRSAQLTGVPPS